MGMIAMQSNLPEQPMDSAVSSLPSIDLLIKKLKLLETQQRKIESRED